MAEALMDVKKLSNYIGGKWVEYQGEVTQVKNPANGEVITEVPLSSAETVNEAVETAKRAQKEWALTPAPQRAEVLYEVGNLMKERKERLSQLLTLENGKVIEEARGEVQRSEEHTSELQSRGHLVCRLLLEKK